MQETQVQYGGQDDLLEKGMATPSSILAQRIPWTEKPGQLQCMGLQRGGHELATEPPPLSYLVKQVEPKCHDFFLAKQKFMFPYIHIYIIDILKV